MKSTQIEVIREPKVAREAIRALGERSPVLSEVELHVFRGAPLYILRSLKGAALSLNVTYFGKRKINVWEPYANWYTAYTPTALRRQGYATQLYKHVEALAIEAGCRRIKSLAGTQLGLLHHIHVGHQVWGVTLRNEVCVDAPLVTHPEYAKRVPASVTRTLRGTTPEPSKPLSLKEIRRRIALTESRQLCYEREDTLAQVTL